MLAVNTQISKQSPKFEAGALVITSFGAATIVKVMHNEYLPDPNMSMVIVVEFSGWKGVGYLQPSAIQKVSPIAKPSSPLFDGISQQITSSARGVISRIMPSRSQASSSVEESPRAAGKFTLVENKPVVVAVPAELRVQTTFGAGVLVKEAREHDGVIHVKLDWGADAYLNKVCVCVCCSTGERD